MYVKYSNNYHMLHPGIFVQSYSEWKMNYVSQKSTKYSTIIRDPFVFSAWAI